MAQLSDDCFAFGGALLTVDAALALIAERVAPVVDAETVPLAAANGRILSRDLVATMNLPPHANSAVDGYAIAHADLAADRETVLPVAGRAAAGHPLDRPLRRGEAIRIFTGAAMPEGADTVMMQETAPPKEQVTGGEDARCGSPGIRSANRRHAGEDLPPAPSHWSPGAASGHLISDCRGARMYGIAGVSPPAGGIAVDRRRGANRAPYWPQARSTTPTARCWRHCSPVSAAWSAISAFRRIAKPSWPMFLLRPAPGTI